MILRNLSVKAYTLISNSGVLESAWGRRQFARAYFLYKQRLDPLYSHLTSRHPELFRGGNILDVGSNIGYMATLFARAADRQFKVYGFEPEPANFATLVETIKAGKYRDRIMPVQAAVGQQDGLAELLRNPNSHAQHRILNSGFKAVVPLTTADLMTVPVVSLDSFVAREQIRPVIFVKVRVLGYELPVCLGMQRTLDANPDLSIALSYMPEVMKAQGFEPTDLIELFEGRGYRFYAVNERGKLFLLPQPKSGIADLLNSPTFYLKSQPLLPDPRLGTMDPSRQGYLELLMTRREMTA